MMENWLHYDRYAVYGLGRSGRAAARLLARQGKDVVASDAASADALDPEVETLPDAIEIITGGNHPADAEVCIVSPGLHPRLDCLEELRRRGVPIVPEIELAADAADAPILAFTGTDGKTTTTSMCGRIAEASDRPSVVGGNIGTPLSDVVESVDASGLIVAEISAFQLWSTHHFRPSVAAFTNVAGDHLDYFDAWDAYVDAKRRLIEYSQADDAAVFSADDETVWGWRHDFPGTSLAYGLDASHNSDFEGTLLYREGRELVAQFTEDKQSLVDLDDVAFRGDHNHLDALCAAGAALAAGLSTDAIGRGLEAFEPLGHRIEEVDTIEGVQFVNDSKATNVHAALAGLQSLDGEFVAIAGGVDKGLDLDPLVTFLADRASGVVLIGEVAGRLGECLRAVGLADDRVEHAGSLEEATKAAFERARDLEDPSPTVILSPASSSFDMFDSYEHRGQVFREIVARLEM
jgi:UDP-N-acetylmuramoylalanine--D-glutamate ligase